MGLYVTAAVVLAAIGFLVWWWVTAKSAGTDKVRAEVSGKTVETQRRMDEAGAKADAENVVDRLRKGGF